MKKILLIIFATLIYTGSWAQCSGVTATGTTKAKVTKSCYDTVVVASYYNTVTMDTATATKLTVTAPIVGSITGNSATVTTNANLTGAVTSSGNATSLGSFSSANLLGALTDETGTGAAAFANTPTFVTPVIGAATGTSVLLSGNSAIGSAIVSSQSFTISKNITGAVTSYGIRNSGTVQSDVTTAVVNYNSEINTQATSFTLADYRHFFASQGTIGAGSSVTNQYGFQVSAAMTGASQNYGFYSNIAASGTTRFNIYMAGTAPNYMAGRLGIMTTALTAPTSDLVVNGSLGLAYAAKTTTYGIGASDYTIDCTSGTFTVTLPTAVSITGRVYVISNTGAGTITLATTSSQTINGSTTQTIAAGGGYSVQSNGANWTCVGKW